MSLILEGIDLPKDGEWLEVIIKPTKEVIVDTIRYKDNALLNTEYGSVIQIPKGHGRLIDGDKLSIEFENQCAGECAACMFEERCVIIDDIAPTILEAEE